MTIRIGTMQIAFRIETRRIRFLRDRFGRPAPELAIGAATLVSATAVLIAMGQLAGVLHRA